MKKSLCLVPIKQAVRLNRVVTQLLSNEGLEPLEPSDVSGDEEEEEVADIPPEGVDEIDGLEE